MYGTISLYQNLKTRTLLIRRYTKHPIGAEAEIGQPVEIAEADLPSRLVGEILRGLDKYGSEPFDEASALAMAPDKAFYKAHSIVSITRRNDGVIVVMPMKRVPKGGSVGCDEDEVRLMPDEVERALYGVVIEALGKAETKPFHDARRRTRGG